MLPLILRRLAYSVTAVIGVTAIVFFLARLTGNPALLYLPEGSTPEMMAQFNHINGFDQPLPVQFWKFVVAAVHLDFGQSLWQQRAASTAILEAFPPTMLLALIAIVLSLILSLILGTLAAIFRFSWLDQTITFFSLALASIPEFWFALVGVLILAIELGWLPTSGNSGVRSWILPVATVMLQPVGVITQVVRAAMIESLVSGYVQNARARGFGKFRLAFRHALRNAALPIITVAGDKAGAILNGTIIVSTIFALPGLGAVMVQAVFNRDFTVIQAGVFFTGIAVILLNVLVDIAYALADPRVRVS